VECTQTTREQLDDDDDGSTRPREFSLSSVHADIADAPFALEHSPLRDDLIQR
jgi:hypothetical protein